MKEIPLPPTSHQPQKYSGPSAEEVLAKRKQFMNPGIFLYYKKPIMLVEGKMQYVWDENGKRYLDGLGGIVTAARREPVVKAFTSGCERLAGRPRQDPVPLR